MPHVTPLDPDKRAKLGAILDAGSGRDAAAAYYALEHPGGRTRLYAYFLEEERLAGFLVVAQTGMDLFSPLVIPFVSHPESLEALVREGLPSNRPFVVQLPEDQRSWIEKVVKVSGWSQTEILQLDPNSFEPVINVLVVEVRSPDGTPRYEIRSQSQIHAAAGLNWSGARTAEVYLDSEPAARGRGFSKSVLAAITGRLLGEGKEVFYRIETDDSVSRTEAYRIGFRPTGAREWIGRGILEPVDQA